MSEVGDATEELWYFAYGANTSQTVLAGRRKIVALSSEAATLPGHRLTFGMRGFPIVEPAFATVVAEPGAAAEGVLHRMSSLDLLRLDGFESRAYARLELDAVGNKSGAVRAQVYVAKNPRTGLTPSRRYVELLLAGAREHGLSEAHIAWLEAHPAVESRFAAAIASDFMRAARALFGRH